MDGRQLYSRKASLPSTSLDFVPMMIMTMMMIMMMTPTVSSPDFLPMSVRGSDIAQTPTWNKKLLRWIGNILKHATWNMVKKLSRW